MGPITWVQHEINVVDCVAVGENKETGSELSGVQSEEGILVMAWPGLARNNCWGIVVLESD